MKQVDRKELLSELFSRVGSEDGLVCARRMCILKVTLCVTWPLSFIVRGEGLTIQNIRKNGALHEARECSPAP